MLAPRLREEAAIAPLRAAWRRDGAVRVEHAFAEAHAAAWLRGLRASEHAAGQRVDATAGFQVWRFGWVPGVDCDHPICELGRWLRGDGLRWVAGLTGLALAPAPDPMWLSDRAAKGSFQDAWNDAAPGRAIALRIQLSPSSWPSSWGGDLELLEGPEGPVRLALAPAWNALDLIDVRGEAAWMRRPMLRRHVDGTTVLGHYHDALSLHI